MNDQNDLISRGYVLSKMGQCPENWTDSDAEIQEEIDWKNYTDIVRTAPAVTPPERTGRWMKYCHSYFGMHQCVCSECKNDEFWKKYFCYGRESYCPNCGCKMKQEEDE